MGIFRKQSAEIESGYLIHNITNMCLNRWYVKYMTHKKSQHPLSNDPKMTHSKHSFHIHVLLPMNMYLIYIPKNQQFFQISLTLLQSQRRYTVHQCEECWCNKTLFYHTRSTALCLYLYTQVTGGDEPVAVSNQIQK